MAHYRVPTVEGRELLLRPLLAAERPQLQLALISSYGNIMEAVALEACDVAALARGALRVAAVARDLHDHEQGGRDLAAAARYEAALARNPWLTESRDQRESRGLR